MGAGPEGALQLQLPAFVPPSLAPGSPETGGHCDTAATHSLWQTGGLGAASQPAGRTKIPSLQLALPSISGHSFLIPLDLSPIARTGALGQPLLSPAHSTTVQALRSKAFGGRDGSGASASCWPTVDVRAHVCPLCSSPVKATAQHGPRSSLRSCVWSPCMPKSSRHLPLSLERRLCLAQIQAGAVVVVDEDGGRQKSWA